MGYITRPGTMIRDYCPDNNESSFYVYEGTYLSSIIEMAKEKWGEDVDLDYLHIEPEYIHTEAIDYDLYDPADWSNFLKISLAYV